MCFARACATSSMIVLFFVYVLWLPRAWYDTVYMPGVLPGAAVWAWIWRGWGNMHLITKVKEKGYEYTILVGRRVTPSGACVRQQHPGSLIEQKNTCIIYTDYDGYYGYLFCRLQTSKPKLPVCTY